MAVHALEPGLANQLASDNVTQAELAPVRRLQGCIGLEYAFDAPAPTPAPVDP